MNLSGSMYFKLITQISDDWQKNVLHDGDESDITLMDELMECQRDWWWLPYFQQLVFNSIVMPFMFFLNTHLIDTKTVADIPYLSVYNWRIFCT